MRPCGLFLALLAARVSLAAPAVEVPQVPAPLELRLHGNVVLIDEVYRSVLHLPPDAHADADTARYVREQLVQFLHQTGYELGQVDVRQDGNALDVHIDEGRLEKIVYRGRLTLQTVRFTLALALPHEVFNRPYLERQTRELADALGISKVWFELVPTARVKHFGPQVESLPPIQGLELVQPRREYELHLFFAEREWDTGTGLDLRSGYPDGLELGLNRQGEGLAFHDDRWRVAASAGATLRDRIVDEKLYPAFSRGEAEVRWYLPPLIPKVGRPFLWLHGEAINRQRPDLNLESYFHALADASAHFQVEVARGVGVSLGGGFRWRRLFDFDVSPGLTLPPTVSASERRLPFLSLRLESVFDPDEPRADRRRLLEAEVRDFFSEGQTPFIAARGSVRAVHEWGWHDLWLSARGVFLHGDVLFHDEEPVAGEHLRGVFPEEFVRRIASASAEFRFSISRDLFKVSVFHDAAVFGSIDRQTGRERTVLGDSFGPGFHALIEGTFQLDLYLAFGFTTDHRFQTGSAAKLQKVF